MTSVLSAVEINNIRILKLMVAVPGSVTQRDLDQSLVRAVTLGYSECVHVLLGARVVSDPGDSSGKSLLKIAAENGKGDILGALIQAGCCVNSCSLSGSSPLHYAAKSGHSGAVSVLLGAGAYKDILDSESNTPLILASKNCHRAWGVMKTLVETKCELDIQNSEKKTALHYAAHSAIGAELLLAAGANPDVCDAGGNTPLMVAATEGFDNIVKHLLNHGADPDISNAFNKAPIHFLAMKNHWEAIDAVASHQGDVDLLDGEAKSALWYAISRNRPEAVKALLRANCKLDPYLVKNGQSVEGVPLELALDRKLYGIAKLLILAGCNVAPLYKWLDTMERARSSRPERHFLFADDVEDESEDEEESEALDWFREWVHSPHSLRQICRIRIRGVMGSRVRQVGDGLPVPPSVRDYLVLREVDDHHVEGHLL